MIGEQFEPGSVSLLKLAMASKGVWNVLVSHLYYRIEMLEPDSDKSRKVLQIPINLLEKHMKAVGLHQNQPLLREALEMVKTCSRNIRELGLLVFVDLYDFRRYYFPNLRRLELGLDLHTSLPSWFPLLFPRMEILSLWRWSEVTDGSDLAFWRSVQENCPQLREIHYGGLRTKLLSFPSSLWSKVAVCTGVRGAFNDVVELCSNKAFNPRKLQIVSSWTDLEECSRVWSLITQFTKLKTLTCWAFTPFVFKDGFPPNLETLKVEFAPVNTSAPSNALGEMTREKIQNALPKSLKTIEIEFEVVDELPEKGTEHYESLLSALLFWDSINSPGFWLSIRAKDYGNKELVKEVKELERDLWERSSRVGRITRVAR